MGCRTRLPNLKKYWGVRLVEVARFGVQRGHNSIFVLNALTGSVIDFFDWGHFWLKAYLSGYKMRPCVFWNMFRLLSSY